MAERMNLIKIYEISKSENFISQLQEWGLIPSEPHYKCPKCESPLGLRPTPQVDGQSWRCRAKVSKRKQKENICDSKISIRSYTFFAGSHLSIFQVLGFAHLWKRNVALNTIANELEFNLNTATDWASYCHEVVYDAMIIKREKIGGFGKIVQIDESKFGKWKYHRGHKVEGQWVFGGIEEESGKVFMVPVEKRDSQTLIPIIKEWILKGTTIFSDFWKAYDCLENEEYEHLKVNHKDNFVDPKTHANTNRIEASWRSAKVNINTGSRKKQFFPSHLAKYMFLKMCRIQSLDHTVTFYKYVGELYNPLQPSEETDIELRDIDIEDTDNDDFN